eukprot:12048215-Alexandrium_andersonii.AAC.1
MERQQAVIRYVEEVDKGLREDSVGHNNGRTWNQQWFSRDSSGTQGSVGTTWGLNRCKTECGGTQQGLNGDATNPSISSVALSVSLFLLLLLFVIIFVFLLLLCPVLFDVLVIVLFSCLSSPSPPDPPLPLSMFANIYIPHPDCALAHFAWNPYRGPIASPLPL